MSRSQGPSWIIYNMNGMGTVPGKGIRSVFHAKLSNNGPGVWTTALTSAALPAAYGGDGKSLGVVIGVFTPYKDAFKVNTEAAALNSKQDDQHLTLSPDGKWAILDRPDGVWLGARKAPGTAFGKPVKVSGLGRNVYPTLGPVAGKMKVFYTDWTTKTILCDDIDLQNARVAGRPVVVYRAVQPGATPISPTPLIGGDGDVEGFFLAEQIKPWTGFGTGDADMVWANDLDPSTPGIMWFQRTDWTANGGAAGGFLYWTHDVGKPLFFHLMHAESAWLLGDDEATGGTANIDTAAVHRTAPSPLVSVVFMAARPAAPIKIADFHGAFALDLSSLVLGAVLQTTGADGTQSLRFQIPNDARLKGLRTALQAVLIDTKTGSRTFTNTAWLHIR